MMVVPMPRYHFSGLHSDYGCFPTWTTMGLCLDRQGDKIWQSKKVYAGGLSREQFIKNVGE